MLKYHFWAYRHDVWTMLMQSYSNDILLFCTINNEGLRLQSPSQDAAIHYPLQTIKECDVFYGRRSLIAEVSISIEDQKAINLIPINPFDPPLFFHRNDSEAQLMHDVILDLKNGKLPACDPNPYIRQLESKDVPSYALNQQGNWDANISPWVYYNSNMQKIDWKRGLNKTIARIFIVTGVTATILAIIYMMVYLISS